MPRNRSNPAAGRASTPGGAGGPGGPGGPGGSRTEPRCDLPMALKVLEDLLSGRLLIYPADLHRRHGGKREAWYKVCAAMAAPGVEWLAVAPTPKDRAYRAGPKCYALGDAALDGVLREHDSIVDTVCEIGASLKRMDAQRRRLRRARQEQGQQRLDAPAPAPAPESESEPESPTHAAPQPDQRPAHGDAA